MCTEMFYIFRTIQIIVLDLVCEACEHDYVFLLTKTRFLPTLTLQTENKAVCDVVQFVVHLLRSHCSVAL